MNPLLEEHVLLLHEDGTRTGRSAPKATVHTAVTPLHAAFSVFLFHPADDTMLLQQRALHKKTWPGVWSNACCGHVAPGETYAHAATRRLREELGVTNTVLSKGAVFQYYGERDGIVENEVCPVYTGIVNEPLTLNPAEVASVQWVPIIEYAQTAFALPIASNEHPINKQSFEAYKALFPTPSAYEQAHTLPSGIRVSEWSLWEYRVLAHGEFDTLKQLRNGENK